MGVMSFVILLFILLQIDSKFEGALEVSLFDFWEYENIFPNFLKFWPLYLWAFITSLFSLLLINENTLKTENIWYRRCVNNESSLFQCLILSLYTGITEEIINQWILFYISILGVKITNFCLFGFCRWFYLSIGAPLTNFLFFNQLGWLLYDRIHWSIGSAALIVNEKSEGAHVYLGSFSSYNSWCFGFFQFWIMFNYGLPLCIVSHVIYDMIIFSMHNIYRV